MFLRGEEIKNAAQVNSSDIQCVEYVLRMMDLSGLPYGIFQSEKTRTHFLLNTHKLLLMEHCASTNLMVNTSTPEQQQRKKTNRIFPVKCNQLFRNVVNVKRLFPVYLVYDTIRCWPQVIFPIEMKFFERKKKMYSLQRSNSNNIYTILYEQERCSTKNTYE